MALLVTPGLTLGSADARPAPRDTAQRGHTDPRLTRDFYVNKTSQAYLAGRAHHRFAKIGNTPQAYWMSNEFMPLNRVKKMARTYARKADRAHRTPLLAIYAIPARDCGGYSAGGFGPRDYKTWIKRMAKGVRGRHAVAILEPDALGHLGSCPGEGDRTGLLRYATRTLAKAGVWVYLDAAHTGWVKPGQMAHRLSRAGIRWARGYSVNVASFVRTSISKRYARRIGSALAKRGLRHKRFLMDTSRNGHGAKTGNNWCNPLDARLGRKPRMVGKGRFDGYVWVKSPGESDGYCHGGPAAGQWWPAYAERLMR